MEGLYRPVRLLIPLPSKLASRTNFYFMEYKLIPSVVKRCVFSVYLLMTYSRERKRLWKGYVYSLEKNPRFKLFRKINHLWYSFLKLSNLRQICKSSMVKGSLNVPTCIFIFVDDSLVTSHSILTGYLFKILPRNIFTKLQCFPLCELHP